MLCLHHVVSHKAFSINLKDVFRIEPLSDNNAKGRIGEELWMWALVFELLLFHLPRKSNLTSLDHRDNNDSYFIAPSCGSETKVRMKHTDINLPYTLNIVRTQSTSTKGTWSMLWAVLYQTSNFCSFCFLSMGQNSIWNTTEPVI